MQGIRGRETFSDSHSCQVKEGRKVTGRGIKHKIPAFVPVRREKMFVLMCVFECVKSVLGCVGGCGGVEG